MPAADDLFRPTVVPDPAEPAEDESEPPQDSADQDRAPARRSSGRVRHDEKMTVYVTSEELLDLEHARLALRRTQGLAVDRGRLVREAIAIALADLEEHGEDSLLVRRLTRS
jgi:hypothetical protein